MVSTHKFQPGDRVRYTGDAPWWASDDSREGTVVKLYEGFDPDTLEDLPYPERWHVSVRLDAVPSNWPYGNKNRFAPEATELELIPDDAA